MTLKKPQGDFNERMTCIHCAYIDYQNPKVLIACFASYQNQLLWMRRKTAPQAGYWFIPTGFMELGERPEEAAARELKEETQAIINPDHLEFFLIGSMPHLSEIYLAYRGELNDITNLGETEEALEVKLFTEEQAPWDQVAFPAVIDSIKQFYCDLNNNQYSVYKGDYDGKTHNFKPIN